MTEEKAPPRFMTVEQAAGELNVSEHQLRGHRSWRVGVSDLDAHIEDAYTRTAGRIASDELEEPGLGHAVTAGSEDPAEWIRLYRSGVTGASVAVACEVENILDVLTVLAAARCDDPSVAGDHRANRGRALAVEESAARQLTLTPGWRRRVAELTDFVAVHGRMPRQKGGDDEETSLGRWLHAQRSKSSKGILGPRQRAALDAIGAWDSRRRERLEEVRLPARLQALVDFRRSHRRLPSYRNRASEHESALGMWLHTLRQADVGGRLPRQVRDALDSAVPGWNS